MSEFTSKGKEQKEEWKSPRAIAEMRKLALRRAFEDEMSEADERLITREEALVRIALMAEYLGDE